MACVYQPTGACISHQNYPNHPQFRAENNPQFSPRIQPIAHIFHGLWDAVRLTCSRRVDTPDTRRGLNDDLLHSAARAAGAPPPRKSYPHPFNTAGAFPPNSTVVNSFGQINFSPRSFCSIQWATGGLKFMIYISALYISRELPSTSCNPQWHNLFITL